MNNREIDALIAKEVFGIRVEWGDPTGYDHPDNYGPMNLDELDGMGEPVYVLCYTAFIGLAWILVNEMKSRGYQVEILVGRDVTTVEVTRSPNADYCEVWRGTHESDSMAICLAILKALGIES